MTFKLACGDVMPGCTARFENADQDALLRDVAAHASSAHGLTQITPDVLEKVRGAILYA